MHGIVKSIPKFTGVLRGEIILTKTNHQLHFQNFSNPRNAASGICRRLDGEGCEHLTIMFYQVLGSDFKTEHEQFEFLKKNGCIVPNYKLCNATEVNKSSLCDVSNSVFFIKSVIANISSLRSLLATNCLSIQHISNPKQLPFSLLDMVLLVRDLHQLIYLYIVS